MLPRSLLFLRAAALALAVLAVCVTLSVAPSTQANQAKQQTLTLATDHGFTSLTVEVADTPETRERGLMYRTELPDNRGMLFLWERPTAVTMWMRNTPLSLDMIFIRPSGVIHRIASNTVPFSEALIPSRGEILGVLEIRAGLARQLGLRPGHKIYHPAFKGEE
jgi:uncharacterized membrane protein (UPF0127 family)